MLKNLVFWYGVLYAKRPRLAATLQKMVLFLLVSLIATVVQFVLVAFLPQIGWFYEARGIEFVFPKVPLYTIFGKQYCWALVGYEVVKDTQGPVVGGGLGYFLAVEIAVLVAQVVNYPLQRKIVFKSHGKVGTEIFAYFVGFLVVTLLMSALNNLWLPLAVVYLPPFVFVLLTVGVMGVVQTVVYYFVFLHIFWSEQKIGKRLVKLSCKRGTHNECVLQKKLHGWLSRYDKAKAESQKQKAKVAHKNKVQQQFAYAKACQKFAQAKPSQKSFWQDFQKQIQQQMDCQEPQDL
ncbi:MAG: hypothetical protein FWD76_03215 [Firmicutes bacterium]|nr:hypothetical protein [Bacillota bacterium]